MCFKVISSIFEIVPNWETSGHVIKKNILKRVNRDFICLLDGKMCLTFEYHMFGRHMGSLEVLLQNTTVFYEFGDKGNKWNKAELNLNSSAVQMVSDNVTIW